MWSAHYVHIVLVFIIVCLHIGGRSRRVVWLDRGKDLGLLGKTWYSNAHSTRWAPTIVLNGAQTPTIGLVNGINWCYFTPTGAVIRLQLPHFVPQNKPWDSKKLHFLASCSRLSFLSQEATSRSLFFWLPATFFSFLAHFWCSRSLIFRLLGPRSSFLAQEAASWKLASWKPKKPILEAKKTSFLNSPRSYFLKSKKLVFLASRKHVKLKMFWFKV